MRITVLTTDGTVIGDSENDPSVMDNHSDRPEVITALSEETGSSIRFSYTLQQKMMYVAIPLESGGQLIGVLRSSLPLTSIDKDSKRNIQKDHLWLSDRYYIDCVYMPYYLTTYKQPSGGVKTGCGAFCKRRPETQSPSVSFL